MHTCVPLIKIERAMSSLLNLNSWRQDNKTKFKLRLMIITFNRFTRCNDAWRILEASYQQVRYVSRNQDGERFRHKLKEVGKKGEFSIPNAHLNCFPSENCVFFFRFYFFFPLVSLLSLYRTLEGDPTWVGRSSKREDGNAHRAAPSKGKFLSIFCCCCFFFKYRSNTREIRPPSVSLFPSTRM